MVADPAKHNFQAVLFDLDGTLLRAEMAEFIPRYVQGLAEYCAPWVKPKKFEQALLQAIRNLIHEEGDGRITNEERVYASMRRDLGLSEERLIASLEHFRLNQLVELRHLIRPIPLARQIVQECRRKDIPLVLATNPVFPWFIIQARMQWAELDEDWFDHVTSYENSHYCKPQPGYFRHLSDLVGVAPQHCLMVGNDLQHDLAAVAVGMPAYLVDTWKVERDGPEWPCAYRGDHGALQRFLNEQLS